MSRNDGADKPVDLGDTSAAKELTEEDLDEMDGGDGGQTTYPPYL